MAVAVQPAKEVATKKKPVTKQRRVVVTGMGVVTPLGHDPDVFYNNLLEGVSGISQIETFDCSQFPTVNFIKDLCCTVGFTLRILFFFFSFRELPERSSLSQLTDGLHRNCQREWINSCFTCLLLGKKPWQMVELLRM